MVAVHNIIPFAALALGQIEAPPGASSLVVYGPLGIICAYLMWKDEKRAKENEKLRESISSVAHEMRGFNLNWLMHNATSSPSPGIREMAAKELERKQAMKVSE